MWSRAPSPWSAWRTAKYLVGFDTLVAVLPGCAWRARVVGGEIMAQVRRRSGFGGVA